MVDNPWAAWLREQEGAQVLPGGAAPSADDASPSAHEEYRGGPFGWDLAPEPGRPRRHLVLAAAALWILVLVVALAAIARPGGDADRAAPSPAPSAGGITGAVEGSGRGGPGAGGRDGSGAGSALAPNPEVADPEVADPEVADPEAGEVAGVVAEGAPGGSGDVSGWPVAAAAPGGGAGETGALLVRAALSAPSGAGSGAGPARYVDATVVTDVEPAGEAQVVSVLALVLTGGGGGWEAAAVERYAVAVGRDPDGSYRGIAGPWALAPPNVPDDAQPPTPDADPQRLALAVQALETAGYRDIADLSLLRDAAHPGVLTAHARGIGPGAAEPADWTLWLRDTDAPTVLGGG